MYTVSVFTCGRWHRYAEAFEVLERRQAGQSAEGTADAAIHSGADFAWVRDQRTREVVMQLPERTRG